MRIMSFCLMMASLAAFGSVQALERPQGEIILTVTGMITETNAPQAAVFDRSMLDALAGRKAEVETPWTSGKVTFEGPLGASLLDAVGATGKTLRVTAINNYAASIPVEDFRKYAVILATKKDGKAISVREKGPIFIIYPFDKDPSLYNEVYFNRSVWQVKSIVVE